MAYRDIGVTAAEMRKMREDGMSNHDIAKSLDRTVQTVRNYIGKQGTRMENLDAFRDKPVVKKVEKVEETPALPVYNPKLISEEYDDVGGGLSAAIDYEARLINLYDNYEAGITLSFDEIPNIVQFLAWFMRVKMEGES